MLLDRGPAPGVLLALPAMLVPGVEELVQPWQHLAAFDDGSNSDRASRRA